MGGIPDWQRGSSSPKYPDIDINPNRLNRSPLATYLDRKMKEAEQEISKQLNEQLFGPQEDEVNLRESIEDALDRHMDFPTATLTPQEDVMNANTEAVETLIAERAEARARDLFIAVDGEINAVLIHDGEKVGTIVKLMIQFNATGTEYHYAAILTENDMWYLTGRETSGLPTEKFKAWIVNKAMDAHRVVLNGTTL